MTRHPRAWLILALVGLALFGWLAEGVADARTGEEVEGLAARDDAIHGWLAPRVPSEMIALSMFLNDAGGTLVTALLVAAATVALLLRRERREAIFVAGTALVLESLILTLKWAFGRERPDGGLVEAAGGSFPSGHSAFGAYVACLMVWFAARHLRGRFAAGAILGVALAWTVAMAASRMALGVHYLTDVLAGAGLGVGVVGLGISVPTIVGRVATMWSILSRGRDLR